jgi:2-desacetyl-2-hydroxyethyl bacteriochlorophyllide A dehydrogenase
VEAPGRLFVVPTDPPQPGPGEALIRVAWAGICGSDVDLVVGRRPAPYVRYPIVPGHEWSGTVEAVGDQVDTGLVGRAVVGEGFRSCQVCAACRRGEPTVCEAPYDETGFTQDGAWADYLSIPTRLLHVLPDGGDRRAAAVIEPAACAAEACLRAATQPDERVAVVGGGTLGLLATQLLRADRPAELVVIDPIATRARLAESCGATAFVAPDKADLLSGRFDVVIEAAGATGSAKLATWLSRRGGRVVLMGIPDHHDHLSTRQIVTKQLTVTTVFGAPPRAWVHAVGAFANGVLDPSVLITHEFVLEDAEAALRTLTDRDSGAVKVLLRP